VFNLLLPQILKKVKEIFETINSRLDTTVSSRLASNDTRLNNLDATISSRLASNDSRLNYLDAPVSSAGKRPRVSVFTSSGNFTVPQGVEVVYVTGCGGGGGGGSGSSNTAHDTTPTAGGGGGASGVSCYRLPLRVSGGTTLSITIGVGGTGGAGLPGGGSQARNGNNGTSGGSTQIYQGSALLLSLPGGAGGGRGDITSNQGVGGAVALNSYPYLQDSGGTTSDKNGGNGGRQFMTLISAPGGTGGSSGGSNGQSAPANSGGGGGGGGAAGNGNASGAGGNGGSGFIMLEWWQ
jgi:hypothetical protein